MLYKKSNNITLKIASPVLVVPFLAHNSIFVGEPESLRGRMWAVSLGNIFFKTLNSNDDEKDLIDEYERFYLKIDSIGLQYFKRERCFKVLDGVQISLDLGVKNKIKAALLKGIEVEAQFLGQNSLQTISPEVVLKAELPDFTFNLTSDVYNGLVNINEIIKSTGPEEELKQLKMEKDQIINSAEYLSEITTRGVKGQLSYWKNYNVVISGAYIYFYKSKRDLMPFHYIFINECKLNQSIDPKDLLATQNTQLSDLKHAIMLKLRNHEKLYFKFNTEKEKQEFTQAFAKVQHEQKGDVNIVNKKEVVSEIIHKDQKEIGLQIELSVGQACIRLWKETEEGIEGQEKGLQNEWLSGKISNLSFQLIKYVYEIKLGFTLSSVVLSENQILQRDFIINEPGQNLCEIDIDVYDIYSPNLEDSEIIIKVALGRLYWLFDPTTINEMFKFFRNTKSSRNKDLESFMLQLMNEDGVDAKDQNHQDKKIESCLNIGLILVKVVVEAQGLCIIAVHHQYKTGLFELSVGKSKFNYHMCYDHDIIKGEFSNARAFDLTNYPKTQDPATTEKASLNNLEKLIRTEIIGLRDDSNDELNQNGIIFETHLFNDNCPLRKPGKTSILKVDLAQLKIMYVFEMSFRIIDYFFDKFLWAITESDPYVNIELNQFHKAETIDFKQLSKSEIENFDLKQERSTTQIIIKVHQPILVIKDRPYSTKSLEINLGEMLVTLEEFEEAGRLRVAPKLKALMSKFVIDGQDLGIKFKENGIEKFEVSKNFNLHLEFSKLNHSINLYKISSHDLDKSFMVTIDMKPKVHMKWTQEIYTFILKCVDLNFGYTDGLEESFNFRIEEEYFKSTDYILKSRIKIDLDFLGLSLFENNEILTELGIKRPYFLIDYFLNKRCNYDIAFDEACSYFIQHQDIYKHLLFGSINQRHRIPVQQDLFNSLYNNLQLIEQEDRANIQPQFNITIAMHPTGQKYFNAIFSQLKLFIHPYFYLMLDHFFREGMPVYDRNSFDKPNEFNEDIEEAEDLNFILNLKDALLCFASQQKSGVSNDKILQTIACQTSVEFEFKREKIKRVKAQLYDKVLSISKIKEKREQPVKIPTNWMRLYLQKLSPFICDLQDLESSQFTEIKKRQLVAPFNLSYHFARYVQYRWEEKQVNLFEKSEVKKEKIMIKMSYNDLRFLFEISKQFNAGYDKFNAFEGEYKRNKKQNLIREGQEELEANFIDSTRKAIRLISSYSGQSGSFKARADKLKSNQSSEVQVNDKKQIFINQHINYERIDFSEVKMNSLGVQVVLINDYKNVFYPVLSMNIPRLEFNSQTEMQRKQSNAYFKCMISYYNASASEWEPLIEKTKINIIQSYHRGQSFLLFNFQNNLNINITTQLMQTLIETYMSLKEKDREDTQAQHLSTILSSRESAHSQMQPQSQFIQPGQDQPNMFSINNSFYRSSIANVAASQLQMTKKDQTQNKYEYKVTPYTIVNYSSRVIKVRSAFNLESRKNHIPKEYEILPGESADYEVDYEEEADQLMRIAAADDIVKKQDFLNIIFDNGKSIIKNVNLRNMNFFYHFFDKKVQEDFVGYGVKFENMRKMLVIRSPYTMTNLTDVNYRLRLIDPTGKQVLKIIEMKPGQCYPISQQEMLYKFSISSEYTPDEWSSSIRIKTVIEKVPKNATTYLFHGKQYTIITKEKSEFQRNFNINFKTPVIIKNALPCTLRIRTDFIKGPLPKELIPKNSTKQEEQYEYEQQEFVIPKSQTIQLYNYNLKSAVQFLFTLNTNIPTQEAFSSQFTWGEAKIINSEFKDEKVFTIKDNNNPNSKLDVYAKMSKSKQAGVMITFYVRNVIINNTDQNILITDDKKMLTAGQQLNQDNSIILLSNRDKVAACLEDLELKRHYSAPFNIDVAAVTNTILIKKENYSFYEFTIKTELSLACADQEIYTKVTTISPCYVLFNKTKKTILITQEECLDQCQIILSGQRVPFFWKDNRKPRLVKIKFVEREGAEYDDDSHDWTFPFSLHEIGRLTIIDRSRKSLKDSKYILIDKQLQEQNQILFITFHEENPQFPTYKIENHSRAIQIEYYQKDHPHNADVIKPQSSAIFSWTNPQAQYSITCKLQDAKHQRSSGKPQILKFDVEPDNLELNEKIELPSFLQTEGNRYLYIYTITNGYSKILTFSDITQEQQLRRRYERIDEELKEGDGIICKTIKLDMVSIGLSLICKTYQGKRKEFIFSYFESLNFIILDTDQRKEIQLKIAYVQFDNNINHKPLFPIIMWPKELAKKRDQKARLLEKQQKNAAKGGKQEQDIEEEFEIKDFFNAHVTMRTDIPDVIFFEQIEFLVQTMSLQMDDEFIGYVYRFSSNITDCLHTNITGVHDVFTSNQIGYGDDWKVMTSNEEEIKQNDQKEFFSILESRDESEDTNEESQVTGLKEQVQGDFFDQVFRSHKTTTRKRGENVTIQQKSDRNKTIDQNKKKLPPNKMIVLTTRESGISQASAFAQVHSQSWLNYNIENQQKKLYIKEYKSSPLDIELSFITRIKMDADQANKQFSLRDKFKTFGLTLVNAEKAPLRINSLVLTNIFGTPDEIVFQLKNHYIQRLKSNLFTIVGSSNILGNPANFVNHLGTGVQDFFYKPIEGMVKGPLEGGKGIIQGTSSLIKNTVQGTFGSASKVLSSVSKGLLFITDDAEFINKREEDNLDKPKNVMEGVGYGLKSTFTGFASGITGVFENPIKGAQREGMKGFMKGTYKGVSGLIVKPISGTLDFFSKTSEGIKNTAAASEKQVTKIRFMRPFYGKVQLIKSYDEFHAYIIQHLVKINRGKYQLNNFIDAFGYEVNSKRFFIILTEENFLVIDQMSKDVIQEFDSKDVVNIKKKDKSLLAIYIVSGEDLVEGFGMKLDNQKYNERCYKKIKNYIYHIQNDI